MQSSTCGQLTRDLLRQFASVTGWSGPYHDAVLYGLTALLVIVTTASPLAAQVQDQNAVLATVNGKTISQSEVDASVMAQLLPLQQQIYALRKAALENVIARTVLEAEANKRGVSVDELRKLLTAGPVQVTTNQVEEVYRENAPAFVAMSPDEAKERLRLDLESQARMQLYRSALSDLKGAAKISVFLEEPRLRISDNGTSPFLGPRDAQVTITEFSDFECPYCREARGTIKQVLSTYNNKVRLVFKHLPLAIHTQAFAAARAAFCAGEENRFWQFHDAVFAAKDLTEEGLSKIASEVGLSERFKACQASESSRAAVQRDLEEAAQLGISSTPTFVVNGLVVRGAVNFDAFKQIIDRELDSIRARNSHDGTGYSVSQKK